MELEDVARITSNLLYQQSATAQTISGRLVELALQLGSSDNCTVIVVNVDNK
jgi:serine/threonine protein phosphatase PrpC